MGKFSNVLFASDFDHTLSDMHNEVPQANCDAIRYFMSEGGIFTVASGRSIPMFRQKAGLVPVNAPCILYNGAACYDYPTQTLEYAEAMADSAADLLAALRERFPNERIEIQTHLLHHVFGEDRNRDIYLQANDTPFAYVTGEVPRPWLKFGIYGKFHSPRFEMPSAATPEELEEIRRIEEFARAHAGDAFTVVRSGPRIVEIFDAKCSKGGAARALANRMGRRILACAGDAPNDITMLQEADYAFCPADSEDLILNLPGVIHAPPSGEGAVAGAIAQLEKLLEKGQNFPE